MNKSLTTQKKYLEFTTPFRAAQYALLSLALVGQGYEADRFAVLEPKPCDGQLEERECRKAKWVQYYLNALMLRVDLDSLPDMNECDTASVGYEDIDMSGTYASKTTALAGANNDVVWTAKTIGSIGNMLQIQYVDPAGNNQALSVSVVGTLIRVSLATGAGGAITSTAALIVAAVAAHAEAKTLIAGTYAGSDTGAGIVTAMAAANLTGGTD